MKEKGEKRKRAQKQEVRQDKEKRCKTEREEKMQDGKDGKDGKKGKKRKEQKERMERKEKNAGEKRKSAAKEQKNIPFRVQYKLFSLYLHPKGYNYFKRLPFKKVYSYGHVFIFFC